MASNSNDTRLMSPLRYPGSKRRLVGYIREALELNNLKPHLFVEPFVGGASVGLQLMQDELVDKVIFIDLDPLIAGFWNVVFFDHEWLCDQINAIDVTLENWHKFKNSKPESLRELALTCLFLNRTNFSGILEEKVGPLGGRKQDSKYKIDCRFPKDTLVKRIEKIAAHKNKVHGVWSCAWDEGLNQIREEQSKGRLPSTELFFYFDPPFFEKSEALYRFYFQDEDHKKLRNQLLSLQEPWILSYDSSPHVEKMYGEAVRNGTKKHDVELLYSIGIMLGRKPTREVIISNLKELPAESRFWKTDSGL